MKGAKWGSRLFKVLGPIMSIFEGFGRGEETQARLIAKMMGDTSAVGVNRIKQIQDKALQKLQKKRHLKAF